MIRAFELKVPKFRLAVFGLIRDWYDALLFNAEGYKMPEAVQSEGERLRELGVELV